MSGTAGFAHAGSPRTHGVSQRPPPSPLPTVCWCSRLSGGTLTCSEGSDPRPRGFGQEAPSVEVWSVRLFLKRQAWIWARERLRNGRVGPRHRARRGEREAPPDARPVLSVQDGCAEPGPHRSEAEAWPSGCGSVPGPVPRPAGQEQMCGFGPRPQTWAGPGFSRGRSPARPSQPHWPLH